MNNILLAIFLLGVLFACNDTGKQMKSNKVDVTKSVELEELNLSFDVPVFSLSSTPQEFKNGVQKIVNEIDKSLPDSDMVEKELTLYDTPNIPIKIWFSKIDNRPIKIEHGVTNDSGQFTGFFTYYFVNGDLWYSDQISAKYLFDAGELKYWLDENWKINQIPEVNFKNREKHEKQIIEHILKDFSSDAAKKCKTSTGKTITISETHPVGQSLSTIEISTQDFEHNYLEIYEDMDPISNVFVADLDDNGFDEIYIFMISAGSGSYGTILGLASNKDKSLSMINFPEIQKGDKNFEGYMGHDTFKIESQKLVRFFPVYSEGDTNQNPTSRTRKLVYGLYAGEAMWQLKVEKSETLY